MAASLYLAPGRASALGNCERGCTQDIMSPDCPTHGFQVTKVRLLNKVRGQFVTGEITLLEGIRLLRYLWKEQGDLPRRERVDPRPLTLVYVETGQFVAWTID